MIGFFLHVNRSVIFIFKTDIQVLDGLEMETNSKACAMTGIVRVDVPFIGCVFFNNIINHIGHILYLDIHVTGIIDIPDTDCCGHPFNYFIHAAHNTADKVFGPCRFSITAEGIKYRR